MPSYPLLSPSKVARLRRCPRLAYYEDILKREPVTRTRGENDFGSVVHRGLEEFYLALSGWRDIEAPGRLVPHAAEHGLEAIDSTGVDEKGVPYGPPQDPHERAAARALLRAYAARYGAEDSATLEVVGIELPFEVDALRGSSACWDRPVRGGRCSACLGSGVWLDQRDCPQCAGRGHLGPRMNGRIDLVVRPRDLRCPAGELAPEGSQVGDRCRGCGAAVMPSGLVVIDHKTTGSKLGSGTVSSPPAHLIAGAEIRLQAGMYVDAVRAMGLGDPSLFVFDYLQRPDFDKRPSGPPKRATKEDANVSSPRWGESPYEYEERLVRLMTTRPAEWFYRKEVKVTPELVRETRANIQDTAAEIKWRTGRGAWPMNDASCSSFNRPCAWIPVCTGGKSPEDPSLYRLKRKEEVER